MTSIEALQRFANALTPCLDGSTTPLRNKTTRGNASARAAKELKKLGF